MIDKEEVRRQNKMVH